MVGRVLQYQVLDQKFDIDHRADILLDIELVRLTRQSAFTHPLTHFPDGCFQRLRIPMLAEHLAANRAKGLFQYVSPTIGRARIRA
jgi:hypothetical protein